MRPEPALKDSDKWHERFYSIAMEVAKWSKDPNGQVGAVAVSPDGLEACWGYNGLPRDMDDSTITDPDELRDLTVHAELNAVVNGSRRFQNWTVYVTKYPCKDCALALVQRGIRRVVAAPPEFSGRWGDSQLQASEVFLAVGVDVVLMTTVGPDDKPVVIKVPVR